MDQKSTGNATTRVSPFVLLIIILTLVLSLTALIIALNVIDTNQLAAGWLMLIGALGVVISTYVLFQARRRNASQKIETLPIVTTVECRKCGFKNTREFQRGDYIFKEVEPCKKCNDKMLITAIYREVKEGEKQRSLF
jgi:hypothetical protein